MQEKCSVLVSDDAYIIFALVTQMIKNMRDARFGAGLYLREVMRGAGRDYMTEDMLEEIVANLTGQIILRFKMAVKCTAANVGGVNNFFYADFFIAGFVQQSYKGINNCLSCPCLSSVHETAPFINSVQKIKIVH